jgi:lysozyme
LNQTAILLTVSGAVLLLAGASHRGSVEAGAGDWLPSFGLDNLTDKAETVINQLTETAAQVPQDVAGQNIAAMLSMIRFAEGTAQSGDPYRVCYGYRHTVGNLADHPAITGEWKGERLSDSMCKNAGFGPGCVSTAAGAYQIIKPTWAKIKGALGLDDFGPNSQDSAAIELIRRRGALEDVKAGRIATAIDKCRNEWASLPGNYAKQGQRSLASLVDWYQQSGGYLA